MINSMGYEYVACYTRVSKYVKKISTICTNFKIPFIFEEKEGYLVLYVDVLRLKKYIHNSKKFRGMDTQKGNFYMMHRLLGENGYIEKTDGTVKY